MKIFLIWIVCCANLLSGIGTSFQTPAVWICTISLWSSKLSREPSGWYNPMREMYIYLQSIDTHIPILNAKTDNNFPYNWLYHFALPTDLSQYWYQRFPMYLQSVHMVDVTNTRWSSLPCWFQTSHIPLHLPDTIPMIWCDWHINNEGISVTDTYWSNFGLFSDYRFGVIHSLDIADACFSIQCLVILVQLCDVLFYI